MSKFFCVLFFASFNVFAILYSKESNGAGCSRLEMRYNEEIADGDLYVAVAREYARCLIFEKEKEEKALSLLHYSADRGDVPAAFYLARYIQTGGTFEMGDRDYDKLNETIMAYLRVLSLIKGDFNYPWGGDRSMNEMEDSIELNSHYQIPITYFHKFIEGAIGIYNLYLMQSPNYNGERDLNTYPDYNLYTQDSLEKTIEHAETCLSLPKKDYFSERDYKAHQSACQVLKDGAQTLLPLEGERLSLLNKRSCRDTLPYCQEYDDLVDGKMIPIIRDAYDELEVIFSELNRFLAEERACVNAELKRRQKLFEEEGIIVTDEFTCDIS